jgi:DNA-binding transcriptional ArsR family regulator
MIGMGSPLADVLMHPVRLRILEAFASPRGSRRLTAQQLAQILDDVPQTSLYRHLGTMQRAGILAIASTRRVRGTTERTYVVAAVPTRLTPSDLAGLDHESHHRYFNAWIASLVAQFSRYLDRDHVDLVADGAGYNSVVLELTDAELRDLGRAINGALRPYVGRRRPEGAARRLLATLLFPLDDVEDAVPPP